MQNSDDSKDESTPKPRRPRYRKVVGPRLKPLLALVFGLFAVLAANAVYLTAVRVLEAVTGNTYQNWFFMNMFLLHLVLGILFVVPVVVFGVAHIRNAHNRPNRRAVRVGYALFVTALVLLVSGLVLTRVEGVIVVKDPTIRSVAFWLHVAAPLVAAWLFVLHRLAGKKINWVIGRRWAIAALVLGVVMVALQAQDPRAWNVAGPESGETYFFPSLARTATGDFIPASVLENDAYCQECHADTHEQWSYSMHRFSSFNNPPYLFSVNETRRVALERDGNVQASRFCAGCHDPVVFFSGRFDDPEFDPEKDPTGQAGITCTVCHAMTHVNSPRGNADYTIEEPIHYPFAFSENRILAYLNRQLVKAKPELHKKTFLKPLHKTAEFCATCHKVHLPEELNGYKWLRGQNHYDSWLLSGVSGHGVASFYYPPEAETNCNDCHMPLMPSDDFGAQRFADNEPLSVHGHLFPSANTAIPHLLDFPSWVNESHEDFSAGPDAEHPDRTGIARVDLFGLRKNGEVDGELIAPLRPNIPPLEAGETYLLETVIRTTGVGHHLTQGTTDSNELWLEVKVTTPNPETGEPTVLAHSGALGEGNAVDPWAHFVNTYMLDREGQRIDRRNAQDIFVPLYSHQIPPGAGEVVHYRLDVPDSVREPVTIHAALHYRKFDTTFMRYIYGPEYQNDLPIMTLAQDRLVLPVAAGNLGPLGQEVEFNPPSDVPEWERFNDYGIGLLRKGRGRGQLRQAEEAFERVEQLGRPEGPLNLARVYLEQGSVQERAVAALERAAAFEPPAPEWSVLWFGAQVDKQNGFLDEAIEKMRNILDASSEEMRRRSFDFSRDYRLLDELGQTLFERAKLERGEARASSRREYLERAESMFVRVLEIDPENVSAHYNLNQLYRQLGQEEKAAEHLASYQKYKPDDNARGRAIAIARAQYEAADHAADAVVIYDLTRTPVRGQR